MANATIQNYTANCRDFYKNTQIGISNLLINQDPASGRSLSTVDSRLIRCDGTGAVLDTKVAIDPTVTNFTMMIAFSKPEISTGGIQYIVASTTPPNIIELSNQASLDILSFKLGQYVEAITFSDVTDIHALCAVYDVATSEVAVAIDGEALPIPIPIVFDGNTAPVYIGAQNTSGAGSYNGYIGECALVADKLTDVEWTEFWNRVNT